MYLYNKKGFTFAECLLALVILGVALAPLLLCFPTGAKQVRLARKMTVATDLCEDLMDEIKKMAFEDPDNPGAPLGTDGGEPSTGPRNDAGNVNDYDDVDDYDGWSKSPPEDMDGNALTDFSSFTRSVAVVYVDESDLNTGVVGPTDFKMIKVTVSEEDISDIELTTVVTKY